ncbi:site-specific integrase [Haloechinothrix salitolerans]|uniref:Tyrosine-type recombinase/integrase n=1 Tax=Haloechinothrix salitolerans TaxID=926830 RepID=A0ABW2BY53_9PSEU
MTAVIERVQESVWMKRRAAGRTRFPARPAAEAWDATQQPRDVVLARLTAPPFVQHKPNSQKVRASGLRLLLDWLEEQPGTTWQQRWLASGAEQAGADWRKVTAAWLRARSEPAQWRQWALSGAVIVATCGDIIRPSLSWLAGGSTGRGALVRNMARSRDVEGFARLRAMCDTDADLSPAETKRTLYRSANILAAKGGTLSDVAVGDVLELLDTENDVLVKRAAGTTAFYRTLHRMGILEPDAPSSLRELRTLGQLTPAELVDRYQLTCRSVRDLLVAYLCERQPTLDYASVKSLAHYLVGLFWADIERHHPGIDSLNLPAEVAAAWKERLRSKTTRVRTDSGTNSDVRVPRISYRESLMPVRALYLDLACWAVEDPARWGPWVAPSPVSAQEIEVRKAKRRHKSRMDARTRERLPVLPKLIHSVDQHRKDAEALLHAGRNAGPGDTFTAAGQTLVRADTPHARAGKVWVEDPDTGQREDLVLAEDYAFWTWAAVEVLRATGVRIEELLELSHHSLVQYRLPTTGELVPLLQIAPSKTDTERLLLVSPELADVLAAIIGRIRNESGAIPLVTAYDHECVWRDPAPLLFQRRVNIEHRALTPDFVRKLLSKALARTDLTEPDGSPLRYTPHDFRRLFITDAVLNGLPPHIAQVIAGHRDINVTLGYKNPRELHPTGEKLRVAC